MSISSGEIERIVRETTAKQNESIQKELRDIKSVLALMYENQKRDRPMMDGVDMFLKEWFGKDYQNSTIE